MRRSWLAALLLSLGFGLATAPAVSAQAPAPPPAAKPVVEDGSILQVKQPDVPLPDATAPTAPAAPTTPTAPTPAPTAAPAPAAPAPSTGGTTNIGGADAAARPAGDVGSLLGQSNASAGVEVQRKSGIVADPRIRGLRFGQITTYGDNGLFLPARLDLDTAASKFGTSSIDNIEVIKGPYSVRYGPGLAFLNIDTLGAPRYQKGFEVHGSSSIGYKSNREGWQGFQSIDMGDRDWGARVAYEILGSNDYRAGNNELVPSSYLSQNTLFTVGFDLSPDATIEFKGLRLVQNDVLYAGNYFDIDRLDTEAYSTKFTLKNQEYFDLFEGTLWYNYTAASGSTVRDSKQDFLTPLLNRAFYGNSFNNSALFNQQTGFSQNPLFPDIRDASTTDFTEMSRGYRFAFAWGQKSKDQPVVTIGQDLNTVHQALVENIRVGPVNATSVRDANGLPVTTAAQDLGIPESDLTNPGIFLDTFIPFSNRLTVNAGIRFDWSHMRSNPRRIRSNVPIVNAAAGVAAPTGDFDPILFSTNPEDPGLSRDFLTWAAYMKGEYKFDEHLTGNVGFGYGVRPPTLTELYAAGPFVAVLQQGLNRLIGDPNLNPERMLQMQMGLSGDYGWFRAGVDGYYAWIRDYITVDQNLGGGGAGGLNQVVFTNTDLATLAGGEAYTEVDLTRNTTPYVSVSYVQGRDWTHIDNRRPANLASSRRSKDTEPLPGIAPLTIRYGVRFHEAIKKESNKPARWTLEFAARNVFEQNLVASSLGEQSTPAYTIYDIRGSYQYSEQLTLLAGAENIGNKFYRDHLDPRAGFPGPIFFRPGTNLYVTAQLKY